MKVETFLTADQLAITLQVTRQTIYNWMKQGCPVSMKNPPRFLLKDVLSWKNKDKN